MAFIFVIVVISVPLYFLALRADRRLQAAVADIRRYRLGYFLRSALIVHALFMLLNSVQATASGKIPVYSVMVLALACFGAKGIHDRRRYGWICLAVVMTASLAPMATVAMLTAEPVALSISLVGVVLIITIAVYATRRWSEMAMSRGPAGSVRRENMATGVLKPIDDMPGSL